MKALVLLNSLCNKKMMSWCLSAYLKNNYEASLYTLWTIFFCEIQDCARAIPFIISRPSSIQLFSSFLNWKFSSRVRDLRIWGRLKHIYCFTPYQKRSFRGASTNEKLTGICVQCKEDCFEKNWYLIHCSSLSW